MIGVGLAAAYLSFVLLIWACRILASRADARDHTRDDSTEWLGIGSDSFPHDRSNGR